MLLSLGMLLKENRQRFIVGAALASFAVLILFFNIRQMGEDNFRILDNNQEHNKRRARRCSLFIEALAANPDKQDSLNSNIQILDELHAYKGATQYNVIRESGKAYTISYLGITAGDNMNSFCYNRLKYCQKSSTEP